jgi:RimJ/RimL family protein N-acetyltransferase
MREPLAGRALLIALKEAAGKDPELVLPVGKPPRALLRPVAWHPDRIRPTDIASLTEWRNRHVKAFLTEFEATDTRTRRWLIDGVGTDDGRILFMVDTPEGQTVGYMGLAFIDWRARSGEADAVVKGVDTPPGTMALSLRTLLDWGREGLNLERLKVRVRSDNPALAFYQKLGFDEDHRVPLREQSEPEMRRWVEDPAASDPRVHLVHMHWSPR